MKTILIVSALVATLLAAFSADASVPNLIPVQGLLTDDQGVVIDDDNVTLIFGIFESGTSSTALWTESHIGVDVDKGFFTVYLGSQTSIDPTILLVSDELWLEMAVGAEVIGRVQLAAVPFALEAQYCGQVGDLEESDIQPILGEACAPGQFLRGWDEDAGVAICDDDQHTSGAVGSDDVHPAEIQLRGSTTSCIDTQFVRAIDQDGNVTCGSDNDTTYVAGTGLELADTTFNVDPTSFATIPTLGRNENGVTLSEDSSEWAVIVSSTIDLKAPGWVVAIGRADMRLSVLQGGTVIQVGISTSATGGTDIPTRSELRPSEVSTHPIFQMSTQTILYFDTAGTKTVYFKGYNSENDTVVAYRGSLILFSVPGAASD